MEEFTFDNEVVRESATVGVFASTRISVASAIIVAVGNSIRGCSDRCIANRELRIMPFRQIGH